MITGPRIKQSIANLEKCSIDNIRLSGVFRILPTKSGCSEFIVATGPLQWWLRQDCKLSLGLFVGPVTVRQIR